MADLLPMHPFVDIFRPMREDEFAALKESIRKHGFDPLRPIITYKGKIVDGRNRELVCRKLGVKGMYKEWNGKGSLADLVWRLNGSSRRHASTGDLAISAANYALALEQEARERQATSTGGRKPQLVANLPQADKGKSRDQAAAKAGVSPRTVQTARKVVTKGSPEVVEAVRNGHIPVSRAVKFVDLPHDQQMKAIEKAEKEAMDGADDLFGEKRKNAKGLIGRATAMLEDDTEAAGVVADLRKAKAGLEKLLAMESH